jgi:hypothetical protein
VADEEIKALIQQALQNEGLWNCVDQNESQFLDVGYPYTHLVLNDASKYEQVLETMRQLKLTNAKDLEYVIRSKWEIVEVVYRGSYYDAKGTLYASSDIGVTLRSKSRIHQLRVAVTDMASRALQEITGAAENDYEKHKQDMVDAVRQYIQILLSGEGRDNSWDPLWPQSDLQIDANGISWLKLQMARG